MIMFIFLHFKKVRVGKFTRAKFRKFDKVLNIKILHRGKNKLQ